MNKLLPAILPVFAALLAAGCAAPRATESAGDVPIRAGTVRLEAPMRSWIEIQRQHVVMQGLDYSCGAAALATVMNYYFGDSVKEIDLLNDIIESLSDPDLEDRKANGLSMLDLKQCAERHGYQVAGVKLTYSSLPKLMGPVIVHLDRKGVLHFAVLRGLKGDRLYLADPSWGNLRMSIDRFEREWTGYALILGKPNFGLPTDYPMAIREFETAGNEELAGRRSIFTAQPRM